MGHIYRLYVSPLRQRVGIGRSLLTVAMARMRERGRSSVTLWVLEDDESARAFYELLGWQLDGERRFDGAFDLRYRTR